MAKGLLSVEDALTRILDGAQPTDLETVRIEDAHNRVLAEDLRATLTQPPFDASAMDGYAVRGSDVATLPAKLTVIGESAAGKSFGGKVSSGDAVRIFTGAPVPEGADAIVIQENVDADGATITVRDGTPDPGHIRHRGMDFSDGETVLTAGTKLSSRHVTLAAAMGHGALPVRRAPRVAILATGNELVPPGSTPGPDQIVASNSYGIAAMVTAFGGAAHLLGNAKDTHESLAEKIAEAQDAGVLLTIGGASVGDHDLVAPALEAAGMRLDFWRIAMRPGKPLLFGRRGPQRVIGVPGNPVSSLICARVFLAPLIAALLGLPGTDDAYERAFLTEPLKRNGPRQHYMRGMLRARTDGGFDVTPAANQDSSLLTPLAQADCLIVRAPDAPALDAGAEVRVMRVDF